ncbi:MAG: glycosyltransferase family 2 protein [Gaiellaceae bacterium]
MPDFACDVSVVIPTRSRWQLLSTAALPAALGQEGVDHEVIVVDDGSDDETPERLAEIDDPRLRALRNESSLGVAAARNAGIGAARGRWVSFLDDDDLWSPRKLRAQLDAAAAAHAVFAYAAGGGLDSGRRFLFAVEPPDPETVTRQLLRWNVIWCGCSNVMARTDLVRDLGGFDERLLQLADWDLWIRLALAGPAAAAPEILVGYVMHEASMLLTDRRDVFPEMEYLAQKHRAASERYGVDFDRALFTRWVARGHRRAGRRWEAARTYLRGVRRHGDVGAIPRALGSLAPETLVELSRRVAATERRSTLRKLAVDEPDWVARFRTT